MAFLQTLGQMLKPIEILSLAISGRLEKASGILECRCYFAEAFQMTSKRSLGKSLG